MKQIEILWQDRKRHLGLPLSFTKYSVSEDRIFCEKGFLILHEVEILLYRVRDLEMKRSLGQRIFGVGSVLVHSSDKTMPVLELKNIRSAKEVKEMLHRQVEASKDARRMRTTEVMGDEHHHHSEGEFDDPDDDGLDQ